MYAQERYCCTQESFSIICMCLPKQTIRRKYTNINRAYFTGGPSSSRQRAQAARTRLIITLLIGNKTNERSLGPDTPRTNHRSLQQCRAIGPTTYCTTHLFLGGGGCIFCPMSASSPPPWSPTFFSTSAAKPVFTGATTTSPEAAALLGTAADAGAAGEATAEPTDPASTRTAEGTGLVGGCAPGAAC